MLAPVGSALSSYAQIPAGPHRAISPPQGRVLVTGTVTQGAGGQPIANARITLFRADLTFFRETRTSASGSYVLERVPPGSYLLGVERPEFAYLEAQVMLASGVTQWNFALVPESEPGRWDIIGNTLPEVFDATDIGALRPNGTVLFCHDTVDPVVFDPVTGTKSFPAGSGSEQGCMNTTVTSHLTVLAECFLRS